MFANEIGEKHLHGDRPAYLSACYRLTRFRPPALEMKAYGLNGDNTQKPQRPRGRL